MGVFSKPTRSPEEVGESFLQQRWELLAHSMRISERRKRGAKKRRGIQAIKRKLTLLLEISSEKTWNKRDSEEHTR